MTQEIEDFDWSEVSERATRLLAVGQLTCEQIAGSLEISRSTIARWKRHPEFKARVDEHIAEIREEVRRVGLADLHQRVQALNSRWLEMQRVIHKRAADPEMAGVPGGSTGLLVRTTKSVGSGESARVVHEYAVDTGLLKELRDHERQAAQELGQWLDKSESNVKVAELPRIKIIEVHVPPGAMSDADRGSGPVGSLHEATDWRPG
jgi:hypothetical protein